MTRRPRWVVDTNTLVSAFLWQGLPGQVIEYAGEKTIQLVTSRALLDELDRVLHYAKLATFVAKTGLTANQMLANFRRLATVVSAAPLPQPVCRDPDDDTVLACAIAAKADVIVSGDKDLLVLERFEDVRIVTVRDALGLI